MVPIAVPGDVILTGALKFPVNDDHRDS